MDYKLVVLDVDGTLLNNEQQITKHTRAALLKIQQMGIKIVLASGRSTHGLAEYVKELELDRNGGFMLSYNGAQIINTETRELLFEKRIPLEMIPFIAKQATHRNLDLFTYHLDSIYTTNPNNEHIIHEAKLNGMKIVEVKYFGAEIDFSPCKIMFVSDNEKELIDLENHLKKRLDGTLDVFRSENHFLEIVPQFINKGNTLNVLMDKLKIPTKKVLAIGEGVCDIPMLQSAGLGIAMENARDSVKLCADLITTTNEEDGVATAIEKYIISEIRPTKIPLEVLNSRAKGTLMGNLGIQYTYASESRFEATMPVDERTRQPFGILHGGASLALAETVAGLGSMLLCQPSEIVVGMQVSGNHISSAHEGDTVRAVATIIHKGNSSHVWNVDIFTSTDRLVSSVRVVNSILVKRNK